MIFRNLVQHLFWMTLVLSIQACTLNVKGQWNRIPGPESVGSGYLFNGTDAIFAASEYGGLFKSEDGGMVWNLCGFGDQRILSIAEYNQELIVCGDLFASRSFDGGNSWNDFSQGLPPSVETVYGVYKIIKQNDIYFAGTNDGLYRYSEQSQKWANLSLGHTIIFDLEVIGTSMIAACPGDGGIRISKDQGLTWTRVWPDLIVWSLQVSGERIYAETFTGIYFSVDEGSNWTQLNFGQSQSQLYALSVCKNKLFIVDDSGRSVISTDNGLTWKSITLPGVYSDFFSPFIMINDQHLFVSGYMNPVYRAPIGSPAQWEYNWLSSCLVDQWVLSGNKIWASTSQGVYFTDNSGESWSRAGLAGKTLDALYADDTCLVAAVNSEQVMYTKDGGSHWSALNRGLEGVTITCFSRNNKNIFCGSDHGVYYWNRPVLTWQSIGLTENRITCLEFKKDSLFAGTEEDGLWFTKDKGSSWGKINLDLQYQNINNLSIVNGSIAVATWEGLFLSNDSGLSWTQELTSSDNRVILSVEIVNDICLAGTDANGVFVSSLVNNNWDEMNSGLPVIYIEDIKSSADRVYLKSYANGLWYSSIPIINGSGEESLQNHFKIYPNPVTDKVWIGSLSGSEELTLTVYGINGICLSEKRIRANTQQDLSNLPEGIYWLVIRNSEEKITARVIKMKSR